MSPTHAKDGMPIAGGSESRGTKSWGQHGPAPARGALLNTVRDEYAERYGISLDELERRQDIPLGERTALNRGEFVRLQQLSRRRLAGTLAEQTAARVPLYRLRAKAAQHIDVSAASNWGAGPMLKLLQTEVQGLQEGFEAAMRRREEQLRDRDLDDRKRKKNEATAATLMRGAFKASSAASSLMSKFKVSPSRRPAPSTPPPFRISPHHGRPLTIKQGSAGSLQSPGRSPGAARPKPNKNRKPAGTPRLLTAEPPPNMLRPLEGGSPAKRRAR